MTIIQSGQSIPLSLSAGQSLVVKDMSGTSSVTGSVTREDAQSRIGQGFFVYGPVASAASVTLTTTGVTDYQIVNGDPTPANQQMLFDPGNPPTSGPTLTGDVAAAVGAAPTITNPYAASVVVAGDVSSQFSDVSGNARHLLAEPANSVAFDLPGFMCTGTGTAAGLVIPAAAMSWNPSTEWLVMSVTGRWSIGPAQALISHGYETGGTGFSVGLSASGFLTITPRVAGVDKAPISAGRLAMTETKAITLSGTFSITNGSNAITYSGALPQTFAVGSSVRGTGIPEGAIVTDISGASVTLSLTATATNAAATLTARTPATDVTVTIAFDPLTGSWFVYRNATLANAYHDNNIPGSSNGYPSANTGGLTRLSGNSGSASATTAMQFSALQIYKGLGALPVTLGSIVRRIYGDPRSVVPVNLFAFPKLTAIMGLVGQSNELGGGGGAANFVAVNSSDGAPCNDGTTDNLGSGTGLNSRWPGVAGAAGKRRVWLRVLNTAQGTTGIADTWVGRCRPYAAGMLVTPGSYVLDANGKVYKAVGTLGTVYALNVTPSSGVGTSELASWTDLGAARAQDVDGAVYTPGDARFDPNGLLADLMAKLTARNGYQKKVVLVSIGQTDVSTATTAAQYAAAMQAVATYFTVSGVAVLLGMTTTSPGSDAWFSSNLRPGRLAALAAMSGNPLVFVGPDLATALGLLPNETNAQPAAMEIVPKLINNGGTYVHLNAAAQALTVGPTDSALAAAGI